MTNRDHDHRPEHQPAHATNAAVGNDHDERAACVHVSDSEDLGTAVRIEEDAIVARATEILFRRMERGAALTDPSVMGTYCAGKLRGYDREVFGVLFLDNRHRPIAFELMFYGTLDGAEVYPREVARTALRHNAAALVVCHNHPSGSTEPSAADRAVTLRLRDALALLDVRLLDHFVIGDGPPTSLAARGWV
jgi:DNA repair protein RadC